MPDYKTKKIVKKTLGNYNQSKTPASNVGNRKKRSSYKSYGLFSFFSAKTVLTALTGLVITATVLIVFLFFDVDRKVSLMLRRSGGGSTLSSIDSDAVTIPEGELIMNGSIEFRLENRGYAKVPLAPVNPGEYSVNGDITQIITREFVSPEGKIVPYQNLLLYKNTGEIFNSKKEKLHSITIEPLMLSALGGGDIKAKRYVPLNEIPTHVQKAVLAIEDSRFYKHAGIDPLGILRAFKENIVSGRFAQGGSTLTQQLAKNTLLSSKKTLTRKVYEVLSAISLEKHLTKDKILEMYLNEIYLGQEGSVAIHGVEEAARTFFGKSIVDVTIAEGAQLAGIIQAPSIYSPRKNPDKSHNRRNIVLDRMYELGFITETIMNSAKKEELKIFPPLLHKKQAPFFTATLEKELTKRLDTDISSLLGVKIHTAIDPEIQLCAEKAITEGVKRMEKQYPALKKNSSKVQQALVVLEPHTGLVKAWVGGRDFRLNQFDRVAQAKRQLGSTIKPFLYLTALDPSLNTYKTATAASILSDEPTEVEGAQDQIWYPENYDHQYRGDVTLRYALEHSLNMPAIYVAQRVGLKALTSTLKNFKVAEEIPQVPALALGALDSSLLNLTVSYAGIANGGISIAPRLFRTVIDAQGEELIKTTPEEERKANEDVVYVLTDIMRGVVERGTARSIRQLGFTRPAAGKTGTSNETRDAWFVGFTPNLVAGVWTGLDDNSKLGLTGASASAPTWGNFMKCASSFIENLDFIPPQSIQHAKIDVQSGELANENCPEENIIEEIFVSGTEPTTYCGLH